MATRRAKLLSEERLPYLTKRECQALARFLERLEAKAGDRVQHVIFFARMQRFLQEHGFALPQDEA